MCCDGAKRDTAWPSQSVPMSMGAIWSSGKPAAKAFSSFDGSMSMGTSRTSAWPSRRSSGDRIFT